jgi:hypothetical protein
MPARQRMQGWLVGLPDVGVLLLLLDAYGGSRQGRDALRDDRQAESNIRATRRVPFRVP